MFCPSRGHYLKAKPRKVTFAGCVLAGGLLGISLAALFPGGAWVVSVCGLYQNQVLPQDKVLRLRPLSSLSVRALHGHRAAKLGNILYLNGILFVLRLARN